jgi:hypothetical protein
MARETLDNLTSSARGAEYWPLASSGQAIHASNLRIDCDSHIRYETACPRSWQKKEDLAPIGSQWTCAGTTRRVFSKHSMLEDETMAPTQLTAPLDEPKPAEFSGLGAFLRPSSMLTPGIAGVLTSGIALPVAINFDLSLKWTSLAISLLLATVIIQNIREHLPAWQRGAYVVLNALVIFCASLGTSVNLDPVPKPENGTADKHGSLSLELLGVRSALAQSPARTEAPSAPASTERVAHPSEPREVRPDARTNDGRVQNDSENREQINARRPQSDREKYEKRWSW